MFSFARLGLLASLLLLGSGCATRHESDDHALIDPVDKSLSILGTVHTSSVGSPPSYPTLQAMLRQQAAREFSVPVDEIVLGSINLEGGEAVLSAPEYATTGLVTVEVPTGGRGPAIWRASAEVRRRVAKQD